MDAALASARALRLSLVLAHQHLAQLTPSVAAAVSANARSKVLFALPPQDARDMAHHVAPYFTAEDLAHRDAYGVVCRLVIDGRDGEPFSLHTRPAPPPWPGRAETLRAAARERGLSQADREQLAQARRVGPATRTPPPGGPPASPAGGGVRPPTPAGQTAPQPTSRRPGPHQHGTPAHHHPRQPHLPHPRPHRPQSREMPVR